MTALKTNPFLVLAASVIAETCAGTVYWFPAIMPGIAQYLNFTSAQSTAIVAAVNSGSLVGVIGGVMHDRYGSRLTASAAALVLSFVYFTLACLVGFAFMLAPAVLFAVVFVIALVITGGAYSLYSSCISASVSVFPQRYRGRVVSLCSTAYGGSAGVLSALQAGFFSDLTQTFDNLLFISCLCFLISILTYMTFPHTADFKMDLLKFDDGDVDESVPLQQGQESEKSRCHAHISAYLRIAYGILLMFVVALQCAALADIYHVAILVKMVAALCVVGSLLLLFILPAATRVGVVPAGTGITSRAEEVIDGDVAEPGLWEACSDSRGIYILCGFLFLAGGCGIGLLVQVPYIVASVQNAEMPLWKGYASSSIIRIVVTLFSSCSVTGRLLTGAILDRGETALERLMWAYKILSTNFLLMAIAVMLLIISREWVILVAVALIGYSYGTWFASSPSIVTLWFGKKSFPRNFAVFGGIIILASLTLDSTVPAWFRWQFGGWKLVPQPGVGADDALICAGFWCRLPISCLLASTMVAMYVAGGLLRNKVREQANIHTF